MATSRLFYKLLRNHAYKVAPRCHVASYNTLYRSRLTNIGYRTVLTSSEPRRRLPIQIISIKKDMSRMQHQIANADFAVRHFAFFPMTIFVTVLTYTICYIALDPDTIAEVRVELDMHGWGPFIFKLGFLKLFSHRFQGGGDDDDDDEDGDQAGDDDGEWEYYYEEVAVDEGEQEQSRE